MGGEAGRHDEQKTGSHAAPCHSRRVLSIAVNPEDHSQMKCGGNTVTQHSIKSQSIQCGRVAVTRHSRRMGSNTAQHRQQQQQQQKQQQQQRISCYISTAAVAEPNPFLLVPGAGSFC